MAEVAGTISAVGSILKTIGATVTLVQGINRAPHEARQVAGQILATRAVLKSLQASLKVVNRPKEFLNLWNGPTRIVLQNIKSTIEKLNGRLGEKGSTPPRLVSLGFWSRLKWSLEREEGMILLGVLAWLTGSEYTLEGSRYVLGGGLVSTTYSASIGASAILTANATRGGDDSETEVVWLKISSISTADVLILSAVPLSSSLTSFHFGV